LVEARLAANRRCADTAAAARPQVGARIAEKEAQLAQLNRRQESFLLAALQEMIDNSLLGQEYMGRLQSFREIAQVLFSAGEMLSGRGVSPIAWDKVEHEDVRQMSHDNWSYEKIIVPGIVMPRAGTASLKLVPAERFVIKLPEKNPWHSVAENLLAFPHEPVALPHLEAAA
jgi:hypothetical protein